MAWDPCASCGKPFHGSTQFTYVTWHQGETRFAYRLRQCLECCADLRNHVMATADVRDDENNWRRLDESIVAPPTLRAATNGHSRGR